MEVVWVAQCYRLFSKYGRGRAAGGLAVADQNQGKVGGCTVNIIDIPAPQGAFGLGGMAVLTTAHRCISRQSSSG